MSSASVPPETFATIVLGAGLRGLAAALAKKRHEPTASLLVVDAAASPGGSVRTQRTNGFLCELGPFAFAANELAPLLALLTHPPQPIEASPVARTGSLRTRDGTTPLTVEPVPLAFRTGNEELPQACRRELGNTLRLGRAATAIDHDGAHFVIRLGGEVPSELRATTLMVALPTATASELLGRFDPGLAAAAARIRTTERVFAFFGGNAPATGSAVFRGYGILPAADLPTPVAEVVFCSEVFPNRALPGRFLIRVELAALPPGTTDDAALTIAENDLRAWTGAAMPFGFCKLHRFRTEVADGAFVECTTRLRALADRVPGLQVVRPTE
jgi:protoporphyrinogen oxidase